MRITVQSNQPVLVTALNASEPAVGEGRILEVSGRHAHLEVALGLEMDQAVKVEWEGHLLLGEVVSIMKTPATSVVMIEIRHLLLERAEAAAS